LKQLIPLICLYIKQDHIVLIHSRGECYPVDQQRLDKEEQADQRGSQSDRYNQQHGLVIRPE
jgi:hypothetical protein